MQLCSKLLRTLELYYSCEKKNSNIHLGLRGGVSGSCRSEQFGGVAAINKEQNISQTSSVLARPIPRGTVPFGASNVPFGSAPESLMCPLVLVTTSTT